MGKLETRLKKLMDDAKGFREHQAKVYEKRYGEPIRNLKAKLLKASNNVDACSHSDTFEYQWEHDNGYGKQTQKKGLECRLCGKRNSWPGMSNNWTDPKDFVYRSAGD